MSEFLTDAQIKALEEEERKRGGRPSSEIEAPKIQKQIQDGFISDSQMNQMDPDSMALGVSDALRAAGKFGLEKLGQAATAFDQYTMGPIRGMIGESLDMPVKRGKPSAASYFFPALAAGETFPEPPSEKDIAARLGMSEEDSIPLPLIADPFTRERVRVSPAGVAGGVAGALLDPLNAVGMGEIDDVARGISRAAKSTGERIGDYAAERGIKSAMGHDKAKILAAARTKRGQVRPRDIDFLHEQGRMLYEPDPNFGGEKAIGWFDKSEDLARKAEERRRFYGEKIGEVGPIVDRLAPDTMAPQVLADEIGQLKDKQSIYGRGPAVASRLSEEEEAFRHRMRGNRLGPPAPLKFKEMQDLQKEAFPFTLGSGDVLRGEKDVNTALNRLVNNRLDVGAETALRRGPTPQESQVLKDYPGNQRKYGLYKDIAGAGAEQDLAAVARRQVSPSTYITGVGTMAAGGGPMAIPAMVAHQIALTRGAAFTGNAANAISKRILRGGALFEKWRPLLTKAGQAGYGAVLATHHQLMNNDPEYRKLMLDMDAQP